MSTALRQPRVWLSVAGTLLIAGGVVTYLAQTPDDVAAHGSSVLAPSVEPTTPAPTATATVRDAAPAPRVTGMPTRILIPALSVDAPVLPITTSDGVLYPPSDPQELGWWADGARPGAKRGSALVTGHTVHTGGGALDDLETLRRGDLVKVHTSHGWIRYTVRAIDVYDKGAVARHAERLFSQQVPGRLVLITCEDWNGVSYLSNVVVTAVVTALPRG